MSDVIPPAFDAPLFTAEQASKVLFLNRNTLLGIIHRYGGALFQIGIVPVKQGATRRFSIGQIGLLSVIRSAVAAKAGEAIFSSLDLLIPHVQLLYEKLTAECSLEVWGNDDTDLRPYLPRSSPPSYLEGRQYFGGDWQFRINQTPKYDGSVELSDLGGFPLPVLLIALDATLRQSWIRSIWAMHGIALGDGAE